MRGKSTRPCPRGSGSGRSRIGGGGEAVGSHCLIESERDQAPKPSERDTRSRVPLVFLSHRRTQAPSRAFPHQSTHLPSRFSSLTRSAAPHLLSLDSPSRRQSKTSGPPSLSNTEPSLIISQRYVERNSLAALIKQLTMSHMAPLERVLVIRSPHHTPAPSSPRHHFLAPLGHRSQ